jgi:hypothetical protein
MAAFSALNGLVLSIVIAQGDGGLLQDAAGVAGPASPAASGVIGQPGGQLLGYGYARDGGHIFFEGVRIDQSGRETLEGFQRALGRRVTLASDVDATSFVALSSEYSKDKDTVYYRWISPGRFWVVEMPSADPATFEVLDFNLAKDANSVWRTDVPIEGADAATAQVVNAGWVWKDRDCVYYQFTRLDGADPETFRYLSQAFYADAKQVYWSSTRLEGADVKTFRTFGDDTPYAADTRHVWFGDSRMPGIDAGSFRLLHNHVFADKDGVYVSGRALPIIDAEMTTFRKVAALDAGGWGCVLFRDAGRAYIFDPHYLEVYTITQTRDAAVISKPVWFAELDGTLRRVATVSTTWQNGVLSEPAIEIQPGFENKPRPMWEVGKMTRLSESIREAMALLEKEPVAATERETKSLQQRDDT